MLALLLVLLLLFLFVLLLLLPLLLPLLLLRYRERFRLFHGLGGLVIKIRNSRSDDTRTHHEGLVIGCPSTQPTHNPAPTAFPPTRGPRNAFTMTHGERRLYLFTCRFASLRSALESFSFFRFFEPCSSVRRSSTPPSSSLSGHVRQRQKHGARRFIEGNHINASKWGFFSR